jgi:hypothetical protein
MTYGVDVIYSSSSPLLNIMKVHQLVQKFFAGARRQTDGQTASLAFSFLSKVD